MRHGGTVCENLPKTGKAKTAQTAPVFQKSSQVQRQSNFVKQKQTEKGLGTYQRETEAQKT